MRTYYTLNNADLKNIGIDTDVQKAEVEQSGWFCTFKPLHEILNTKYGEFKAAVLAHDLTDEQKMYIMKNCDCVEYDDY